MTKSDLLAMIEQATDANLFSAVRMDGIFDDVRTRTVARQARPFPALTEVAKHQAEKVFTNVEGTLAGFCSPTYAQGSGVGGFTCTFCGRINRPEDTHSTIGSAPAGCRFAQA